MAMHGIGAVQMACQQELAAKQAMDRSTYASCDEPKQILMGAISRVVEIQGNRINDVLGSLSLFLDRFFGPQPDAATTTGAATPQPMGIIHEVERNLSRSDYLLSELEQKIRRLGDIA